MLQPLTSLNYGAPRFPFANDAGLKLGNFESFRLL